ncbi:hypothetical protein NL478_26605, partial [Klebsiella pneumoniae]|nr:hypothetical protein [Klebsiella pneumoniae]
AFLVFRFFGDGRRAVFSRHHSPLVVGTMAKSLRSKWRRKMRAIKRIRYGAKELDRLKKMLVNAGEIEVKEGGEIEHVCLVKAKAEDEKKMQLEKEK